MRKEQLLNIYEDNGLYGAKDQNGQIVITAQYTEMYQFSCGLSHCICVTHGVALFFFCIYSTHKENPCNLCETHSFHSFGIYVQSPNHYFCTKFFEVVFLNWCFRCFGCFRCFRCFKCFKCFGCFRCSYFSLLNYL